MIRLYVAALVVLAFVPNLSSAVDIKNVRPCYGSHGPTRYSAKCLPGDNLIITHEPTFYSHLDKTDSFEKEHDAVWADKERFIKEHHLVVWRFHDHWHLRRPDGIMTGVVRALVVLRARRATRDRVLGVAPISARYAGVVPCPCGAVMRAAGERHSPARPTRRSSRPLRARDRWLFDTFWQRARGG